MTTRPSKGKGSRMVLGQALSGRDNALNFARLILAVCVLVSHCWPLGGLGGEPSLGGETLGAWSVAGFFAISGYLIPLSRQRSSLREFALKRALRILPGLWLCLTVTAFVLAPLSAGFVHVEYSAADAACYIIMNAGTAYLDPAIGHELTNVPFPDAWNGSLWTLQYEVLCYAVVAMAVSGKRIYQRTSLGVAVALLAFGTCVGGHVASLLAFFAAGWLLSVARESVPVAPGLALSAMIAIAGVAGATGRFALAALPIAYLMLSFGAASPVRLGVHRDLSYGMYIFAFPLQQVLVLGGVQQMGAIALALASTALTLSFAWLSWTHVEAPALEVAARTSVSTLQ